MEPMQWLPYLLASALKGTVLLGLAGLGAMQLRRASAAARHLVWHIAVLGVLALPVVSVFAPSWEVLPTLGLERLAQLPSQARAGSPGRLTQQVALPEENADPSSPGDRADAGARTAVVAAEATRRSRAGDPGQAGAAPRSPLGLPSLPLGTWLFVLWCAGAAVVIARLGLGTVVVHWFTWRAQPVQASSWASLNETMSFAVGLGHPVRLLKSARATTPMTFGVLNPVVLLPHDADEWPEDRRRVVLLHELAHVQRLDSLTNIFATIACAVYWFNPLVWIAVRRMRAEGERACDDWVLRAGMRASTYAEHLLDMVKTIGRLHTPAAALPMAQRSTFEGRLLAILEPGMNRNGTRRGQAVLLTGVIALVVLPLAAMTSPAAARNDKADLEQESALDTDGSALPLSLFERHGSRIAGGASQSPSSPQDGAVDATTESEQDLEQAQDVDGWAEPKLNAKALSALLAALGDGDVEVRLSTIRTLGSAGDPRAVAALSAALRTDKDPGVRRAAAWALGQIEDERAVPALVEALRGDSDIEVRRSAAWALGQIGSGTAVAGLGAAIRDADKELRSTAVWALGQIGEGEAIPALSAALRDGDASIRNQAAWALGQIGENLGVAPLTAALRDSDAQVRQTAVWALGQIGEDSAVAPLTGLLTDADAKVRQQATWALGQIGSDQAVAGISRMVGDDDASVRETATWALGQIGAGAATPALATALKDALPRVRSSAAWALGQIGERPAPEVLHEALRDTDVEVRRTAAWALGQIEDPSSVTALRAAMNDADAIVKRSVMRALTRLGDEAAYDALAELLKDPDPEVRRQAAAALGGQGGAWIDPRPRPRPQPRPAPRPRPDGW